MKKYRTLSLILLLVFAYACGHDVEKEMGQSYTPASIKYQPRLIYPNFAQEKAYSGISKAMLTISDAGNVEKVTLSKSSGYDMLDASAIEYCKSMIFNPAKLGEKAVYSRMEWEIKFAFSDVDLSISRYVTDIKELNNSLAQASPASKNEIEREIFMRHNAFLDKMHDALNFNTTLEQILLPVTSKEWKKEWNSWPLSFLLYHDFMTRFPEYDSLSSVKAKLISSLKCDIKYIKNTTDVNYDVKMEKENILGRIKNFISSHYPEINLNELGFERNTSMKSSADQQSYVYGR